MTEDPSRWQRMLGYIVNDSWPARAVKGAYSAATLPGDVYSGRVDPTSNEGVQRAADLAGMLTLGAGAFPAASGDMRMGAYFRRSQRPDTPDNGTGYSMFVANSPERISSYGPNLWHIETDNIPATSILSADDPRFVRDTYRALRREGETPSDARALLGELNPKDIVDSAGIWDSAGFGDAGYVQKLWERVLEPNGVAAIKTNNGLLLFDPSYARRIDEGVK